LGKQAGEATGVQICGQSLRDGDEIGEEESYDNIRLEKK
jgi:hypothetical protein